MNINRYATDAGKIVIVQDTDKYDDITALEPGMPWSRDGVLTQEGEDAKDAFSGLYLTLPFQYAADFDLRPEKWAYLQEFVLVDPNPQDMSTTETLMTYPIAGDENLSQVELRYKLTTDGQAYATATTRMMYDGSPILPDGNTLLGVGTSSDGTNVDMGSVQFILATSNLSAASVVTLTLSLRVGVYVVTADFAAVSDPSALANLKDWIEHATADNPDPYPVDPPPEDYPTGGEPGDQPPADDIPEDSDPTLQAIDTGFISLYSPSVAELNALASYLWAQSWFDITNLTKQLVANPMDSILGLSILPVAATTSGTREVKAGNLSTGVSMPVVSSQFKTVDCGSLQVIPVDDSYLDYAPFMKFDLYLPFIGIKSISADDIMRRTVSIKYKVDLLTGSCVANVRVSTATGSTLLYTFQGACAAELPITANTYTNVLSTVLNVGVSTASILASGGSAAPFVAPGLIASMTGAFKQTVQKSGSMSGGTMRMAHLKPFFIRTRPHRVGAVGQNTFTGYPSYQTFSLSACLGYTEVESIHLQNVTATEEELAEIEAALKSGIVIPEGA